MINAATSATTLGGTCIDARVMAAMTEASKCFVYIPELQASARRYFADVTGAEAGLPVAGAVARLFL
ncbi:MAG: selenocysteine synthase, partial [Candidatus Bathyarchaeota archaeon]|nr:selenocysteine synthase [Candidatus Bathyarchaeota archaeon]